MEELEQAARTFLSDATAVVGSSQAGSAVTTARETARWRPGARSSTSFSTITSAPRAIGAAGVGDQDQTGATPTRHEAGHIGERRGKAFNSPESDGPSGGAVAVVVCPASSCAPRSRD